MASNVLSIDLNICSQMSIQSDNPLNPLNPLNDNQMNTSFTLITITVKDIELKNKCIVCMDDFVSEDTIMRLICGHCYHQNCIKRWLSTRSSCPQCRHSLTDNPFYVESDDESEDESEIGFSFDSRDDESDEERIRRIFEYDRYIRDSLLSSDSEDNEEEEDNAEEDKGIDNKDINNMTNDLNCTQNNNNENNETNGPIICSVDKSLGEYDDSFSDDIFDH